MPLDSDYLWAAIFGGLVGFVEILGRYRDAPFRTAARPASFIYMVINAAAAAAALFMIGVFGVTFGLDDKLEQLQWVRVGVAGFGAMLILRSSVFVYPMGDREMSIGPGIVFQTLLGALDRRVDRKRAEERADAVDKAMEGVSFSKASDSLPTIAIALMQNLPREDSDKIVDQVQSLSGEEGAKLTERSKALALGLTLMTFVGEDVLYKAIELIKGEIEEEPLLSSIESFLTGGLLGRARRGKKTVQAVSAEEKEKKEEEQQSTDE